MNPTDHNNLLDAIDARTKLAGSNKMEILLFSLGSQELFGINVFKVREVTNTPEITKTPNVPRGVEGFISLRGNIIPVISLSSFINLGGAAECTNETLIVTEFSRHTQGFLVKSVDRIIRVDWDKVKPPQEMLAGNEGLITAITELPDGRLISILDVEQLLASAIGEPSIPELAQFQDNIERFIFFADDSQVARKSIVSVLDRMGIKFQQAQDPRCPRPTGEQAAARNPAPHPHRCRNARNGWLRTDQEHQERPALRRHTGGHALLPVIRSQQDHGNAGRS